MNAMGRHFSWKRRLGILLAAMWLGLGCATAQAEELFVSGAASLTNAFGEIKTLFEKAHPGVTVHTNFAASNPLLKQMQEGAPVDVFASADQETMDKAGKAGLIDPATRRERSRDSLWLCAGSPKVATFRKASCFPWAQ